MVVVGLVLAGIAALIHVFIFYLESIAWTGERARKIFGTGTVERAEAQQKLAFNQGFYNLFLAVVTGLGIIVHTAGQMVAASLVLLLSSPDKASAALKQGVIPALGVIALLIGLITS